MQRNRDIEDDRGYFRSRMWSMAMSHDVCLMREGGHFGPERVVPAIAISEL